MAIGFSNGGGFGMYLNWKYSDWVTKAVAIDYWAYANYQSWLPQTMPANAPVKLNAHIWTNCATGYWKYQANYDPTVVVADAEAIMTSVNFWDLAGLTVLNPGGVVAGTTYPA